MEKKLILLIFSLKTYNVCFGSKIRKLGIPQQTPDFFYIIVGFKGVYFFTEMVF